ncbi:hypothetical protein BDZ45DRAFT_748179 [Acephala macrosclerotiorum]|nr:hypothetical protein BDZ45DRAFT_748179 [Acephala macrosclerotiorum]
MDSRGDALAVDAAAIVTSVDSSTAITSSVDHGVSSSSPPPVFDEKKLEEHVAAFEDKIEPVSSSASLRRMFSHPIWGGIKGIKGTNTGELHVPHMDFKIPNVDISIDGYFVSATRKCQETNIDKVGMSDQERWISIRSGRPSCVCMAALPRECYFLWSSLHSVGVSNILLTILGFVVGRKAWATLTVQSRNLARYIWVHVLEREDDAGFSCSTAISLIHALAVSIKHQLRFEPYTYYPDMTDLVGHLDTFAKAAEHTGLQDPKPPINKWKEIGEYFGGERGNWQSSKVMLDMSAYFEIVINNGTMSSTIIYGQVLNAMAAVTDTIATAN